MNDCTCTVVTAPLTPPVRIKNPDCTLHSDADPVTPLTPTPDNPAP